MYRILQLLGISLSLLWVQSASAAIDPNAAEVLLRKSCTENGATFNNCFTSLNTLNTWIWSVRKPGTVSPRTPLLVSIGPGTFGGSFRCDYVADDDPVAPGVQHRGHVTLRGSGVNTTVLERGVTSPDAIILTNQCDNLSFEDMSIRSAHPFSINNFGGLTIWTNVEIESTGYAWSDGIQGPCDGSRPRGKHIWKSSRITATTGSGGSPNGDAVAYYNTCDDALFLGTEVTAHATVNTLRAVAIYSYEGVVRTYGGAIRALADTGVTAQEMSAVVGATPNTEIHIHGTGIDMISKGSNHLVALDSIGAMIHANGAAYMLKTGTNGTRTRLRSHDADMGVPRAIMAPYLWEPMPMAPAIISETGQDTVVVTDTSDGKPHTLVYDESCSTDWFDNMTKACYTH